MCGIVGALVFENASFRVTEPYITRMRDVMTHRGPDGAGVWVATDGRVGLGHRRLSIIDLSDAATQPMCNEDGTVWVSFNGEIYNHAEIRSGFESTGGHRWKTDHSDTEVIASCIRGVGNRVPSKVPGHVCYSPMGCQSPRTLARQGSNWHQAALLQHPPWTDHLRIRNQGAAQDPDQPRSVHEEAFFHYLSFLTTPAPQTLFDGIRKLPGGTWLRVKEDGTITEHRYWDVWDHTNPLIGWSEDDIAARLLDELRTAVKYRKVSDVPVGVFLSGGIDSSTNAALFSEGETRPVKTFSIGYQGEYQSYQNELHFARRWLKK